jgi:hypothetical protein
VTRESLRRFATGNHTDAIRPPKPEQNDQESEAA